MGKRRSAVSLLRDHRGGHATVSNLELFFDLVYVFAITQISAFMRDHLTALGLGQATVALLAVWWAWIYTAWSTNWANPDAVAVRLMMLAAMLVSLVLAAVLPRAFDGDHHALVFATCYGGLQIGRTVFMMWAMAGERRGASRNMARITLWFAGSAPLWIIGALSSEPHRQLVLWAAALVIEYAGPFAFFRVPGLGRSSPADWDISGSHLAERASLFVLIALGEAVVVTGTAFAAEPPTWARAEALLASFAGSALLWWVYFDLGAERGARHIAANADAGRIARNAYTYWHLPIIAGLIVAAVSDALLMAAPAGAASVPLIATAGGGAMLFLAGLGAFKRFSSPRGNVPLSHAVGFALIGLLAGVGHFVALPAALFAALVSAALLVVAVWEWGSFHGGWVERLQNAGWWPGA